MVLHTLMALSFLISLSLVLYHAIGSFVTTGNMTVPAAQSGGASSLAPPGFYSHTCSHKMVSCI